MATVKATKQVIEVSAIAADVDVLAESRYDAVEGMPLKAVKFVPGAVNDRVVILDGSDTDLPTCCELLSTDGEPRGDGLFGDVVIKPIIDFSACTLSAGHKVLFIYDVKLIKQPE